MNYLSEFNHLWTLTYKYFNECFLISNKVVYLQQKDVSLTFKKEIKMVLLSNVVSGAIGYGVASARKSNALTELIDQKVRTNSNSKTLRDLVEEYAKSRGIYTQNNQLAHELHKLADQYEEYDYDRYY